MAPIPPEVRALYRLADAGGRLVSVRPRPGGVRVLVRVEMPSPAAAARARDWLHLLGVTPGGNDTTWETQVVFNVPIAALTRGGRTSVIGAGPSGSAPFAFPPHPHP